MYLQTVMLQGGLGNQLFQLAWARYVQLITGGPVFCNSDDLLEKEAHNGIKISDIIDFDHERESESCVFFQSGLLPKALRFFLRKIYISKINNYLLYDCDANLSFSKALKAAAARYHFGYFQYVESALFVREELKLEIKRKHYELISKGLDLYSESVGVHVRRGDFLASKDPRHQVMGEEYYLKAIHSFNDRDFVVFTDDKEWCEKVFKGQNFKICGLLGGGVKPAIADFLSLMCCKDYIIGTSTFAWWSAFLSLNEKPKVYMPQANLPFQSAASNDLIGWDYELHD
ncbi:alpha-1,2-fucosyltransferase [Pseudomonas protegens]|uniref:alpha-1,2-fucosyltransferase n=1 Tax=Pseudomonas protegens TaxID=380021 RepID=UPI0038050936